MNITGKINKHQGFTLIELLVGVAVGLLVVGGVTALFIPSMVTYRNTQAISHIQETERFAMDTFGQFFDQAGYFGCDSTDPRRIVNVTDLPNQVAPWTIQLASPIQILSGDANADAILGGPTGQDKDADDNKRVVDGGQTIGDVITVNFAGGNSDIMVINHSPGAEEITFRGSQVNALNEQFVLLNDCESASLFQVANGSFDDGSTPSNTSDDTTTFSYAAADTINCEATDGSGGSLGVLLGGDSNANCDNSAGTDLYSNYTFSAGSVGATLSSTSLYLAESGIDGSVPSLFTRTVSAGGSGVAELLPGVENMRARYGFNGSGGGVFYKTAKSFTNDPDVDGDGVNETLRDVVSVEINLLLRSDQASGARGRNDRQKLLFLNVDGDLPPVDCSVSGNTNLENSACPQFLNAAGTNESSRVRRVVRKRFNVRNITL